MGEKRDKNWERKRMRGWDNEVGVSEGGQR